MDWHISKAYVKIGMAYLVDTNILIYTLEGRFNPEPFSPEAWHFSFVSELELYAKRGLTAEQKAMIENLLRACNECSYHSYIGKIARNLVEKYHLKIPDAIIAATALFYEYPPITADRGLEKVKELELLLYKNL